MTIFVDFVYEPFRDNNEDITGVIAVAHDVTQQILSRKKIEEAEARARLAIDAADLGVYELDYDNSRMEYSPRFMEIWGVQKIHNRTELASRMHKDDLKIRELAHQDSFKTGNLDYEARINKEDGSQAWIRATGKVLKDAAGNPGRIVWSGCCQCPSLP